MKRYIREIKQIIHNGHVLKGFTLIELLVIMMMIGILATTSIASFNLFNNNQVFQAAVSDVTSMLATAKSKAFTQARPTQCMNSTVSEYQVTFNTGTSTYQLEVVCGGSTYVVDSKNLPPSVSFLQSSSPAVVFKALTGTSPTPAQVVLFSDGSARTINVSPQGSIAVSALAKYTAPTESPAPSVTSVLPSGTIPTTAPTQSFPVPTTSATSVPTSVPPTPTRTPTPVPPTSTPQPVSFRAAANAGTSGFATSLTINKPTAIVASDVLLAVITVRNVGNVITPPSGWTLMDSISSTGSMKQSVYYRVAGSSEPASYRWNYSISEQATGAIIAYANVNTSNLLDGLSKRYNPDVGSAMTATGITTTATRDMLVYIAGATINTTVTPPSGMTERVERNGGNTTTYVADQLLSTSGATGNKIGTAAATGVYSSLTFLLALRGM